jgi:hypothetical protein
MASPVTASGSPPVTSISCPDDGDSVIADDIRAPVAALLANDGDLYTKVAALTADDSKTTVSQFTLNTVGIGGSSVESFTDVAYVASTVVLVTLASAAVGDVIDASLTFDVQTNAVAGDYYVRLVAVEDFGGAGTVTAIPGAEWVTRTPDRIQAKLQGSLTVSTAGPLRVRLEGHGPTSGLGDFIRHYGTGALIVRRIHVGA